MMMNKNTFGMGQYDNYAIKLRKSFEQLKYVSVNEKNAFEFCILWVKTNMQNNVFKIVPFGVFQKLKLIRKKSLPKLKQSFKKCKMKTTAVM